MQVNKFKEIEIVQSVFSDHSDMKLVISITSGKLKYPQIYGIRQYAPAQPMS